MNDMVALVVAYVPPGAQRDEAVCLMRLGAKFKRHHGKKPGHLSRLALDCASRAGPPYSFVQLLYELDLMASRRESDGERASPVEKVDRVYQLVTLHIPKRGRVQVPFGTLRNHLTAAKKKLKTDFPHTAKP